MSWPSSPPQERKILLLVAEGKTNKEIAAEVFLSDKTVKNYVSSILSKLNLQRRTQAAAFVAKHHLVARGSLAGGLGSSAIELSQQPARGALGRDVQQRAVRDPPDDPAGRRVPAGDASARRGRATQRPGEDREERGQAGGAPADLDLPAVIESARARPGRRTPPCRRSRATAGR